MKVYRHFQKSEAVGDRRVAGKLPRHNKPTPRT